MWCSHTFTPERFLEKQYDEKKYKLFKLSNRITFFYKDVIIYPFVFVENCKKGLKVSAAHHNDIVIYAKKTGYRRLNRMNLRGSKKWTCFLLHLPFLLMLWKFISGKACISSHIFLLYLTMWTKLTVSDGINLQVLFKRTSLFMHWFDYAGMWYESLASHCLWTSCGGRSYQILSVCMKVHK